MITFFGPDYAAEIQTYTDIWPYVSEIPEHKLFLNLIASAVKLRKYMLKISIRWSE